MPNCKSGQSFASRQVGLNAWRTASLRTGAEAVSDPKRIPFAGAGLPRLYLDTQSDRALESADRQKGSKAHQQK